MSHTIHLQPVRLQPSGDDLQILIGWAKLLAKFIGREPLVIIRGGFVLLVIKQLAQSEFLLWAALKDQQHALHGLVGCSNSHIELWTGKGMRVSFQRNQAAFVHSLRDHRPLRDLLRARSEREGKKSAKKSNGRTDSHSDTPSPKPQATNFHKLLDQQPQSRRRGRIRQL